jgi:hypothetical protein
MKQLLIILSSICAFSICLPASALPIVNLTTSSAADGLVLIHGHGHHYGWYHGRGHHYGWWRGRHRGW